VVFHSRVTCGALFLGWMDGWMGGRKYLSASDVCSLWLFLAFLHMLLFFFFLLNDEISDGLVCGCGQIQLMYLYYSPPDMNERSIFNACKRICLSLNN
jgi:hypothetical protein